MKRVCKAPVFAFFGFFVELFMLFLLKENFSLKIIPSFIFMVLFFYIYRLLIYHKKIHEMSYLRKELKNFWVRQSPENRISFAFLGGIVVVLSNTFLWNKYELLTLWSLGFVATGLTQMIFEQVRTRINNVTLYFSSFNKKSKNFLEVKQDEDAATIV